jgi:hypothetical protein
MRQNVTIRQHGNRCHITNSSDCPKTEPTGVSGSLGYDFTILDPIWAGPPASG